MVDFFWHKSKKLRVRVAALIQNEKGEILLIKQKKKNRDYWLLPGGGIEFGESATDTLARELKEELNLVVESFEFLLLNESIDPKGNRHLIQLVFNVNVESNTPSIPKNEKAVIDFGYFSIESINEMELRPDIKSYFQNRNFQKSVFIKSNWVSG